MAELYIKSVFLNLFAWRVGVKFMENFKGVESYKSLGTCSL
jgi:hypothetical protein